MKPNKLRRQICYEAARAMYFRHESEYYRAKHKAARRICKGWIKPADLPSNSEIRDEIQALARLFEGSSRTDNLLQMRLVALRVMQLLERFSPKLIGSTLTGHIRHGSDIDIHVFSDSVEAITLALDQQMLFYDVERKRVRKENVEQVFTHIHLKDLFPIELTCYGTKLSSHCFKSSITGKPIERATIAQLRHLLLREYPELELDSAVQQMDEAPDRFQLYAALLLPLENVKGHQKFHPEGDVLYHSLQVFDLARDELPYDEDFLLAALLHDIGKGIDPDDHVQAALEALEGFVSQRTAWLIEHHMEVHRILDGSIGIRAHRRLRENESYEELLLLGQCDREGRVPGVRASELEEAIEYIRQLSYGLDNF
ncbi:MAG: HD domain-containing protein [Planctomycetales bacterium]|nr:HD domain-containing protein [Planctomycetales bacterium]